MNYELLVDTNSTSYRFICNFVAKTISNFDMTMFRNSLNSSLSLVLTLFCAAILKAILSQIFTISALHDLTRNNASFIATIL